MGSGHTLISTPVSAQHLSDSVLEVSVLVLSDNTEYPPQQALAYSQISQEGDITYNWGPPLILKCQLETGWVLKPPPLQLPIELRPVGSLSSLVLGSASWLSHGPFL